MRKYRLFLLDRYQDASFLEDYSTKETDILPTVLPSREHHAFYLQNPPGPDDSFFRIGIKLTALTVLVLSFVIIELVNFYIFQASLLILVLTEAVGIVIFSTLLAKWAGWYWREKEESEPTRPTAPLKHAQPSSSKQARPFAMLQTDTVGYLQAVKQAKE